MLFAYQIINWAKKLLFAQFLHKVDLNEREGTAFLDLTFTAATNYAR